MRRYLALLDLIAACGIVCWTMLAIPRAAFAQTYVSLTIIILRPHTLLSDWRSDPMSVQVTLVNTTSSTQTLRLSGTVDNPSTGVHVVTKDDDPRIPKIILAPFASRTLNGNSPEFALFNPDAITISGTDVGTIQRTGALPEGSYTLCIRAVDYDAPHTPRSAQLCPSFSVQYIDPPRTIEPTCGMVVTPTAPQALIFLWTQPTPPPSSGLTDYNFVMCEVPHGRDPNDAFSSRTSPDFFSRTFHNQTEFIASESEPTLVRGHTYAWRVQAVDPTGHTLFRNNGASEVCSFTYGSGDTSGLTGGTSGGGAGTCSNPTVTGAYPPNGERVPYRYVPVIVHFDPYCDSFHRFQSSFTGGGGTETRDLAWSPNPLAAQIAALGESITQSQAQYIWIGRHGATPY